MSLRPSVRLRLALACIAAVDAWEVTFGDCIFRNGRSDELLRSGSCSSQTGILNLSSKSPKIKSLTPGVFDGMAGVT